MKKAVFFAGFVISISAFAEPIDCITDKTVSLECKDFRARVAKEDARRMATYKAVNAHKVPKRGVSIGMSMQEALASSWGKPRKVNRTITATRIREQWVYSGSYLYFEDGVLTSIQN